jgi:hypothetical protein
MQYIALLCFPTCASMSHTVWSQAWLVASTQSSKQLTAAPGLPGTHQRHAVDEHVRQLLGVDLPQGGQVRVAAQQLEHVAHGLAVARQPDLAHARQPRLAHLCKQQVSKWVLFKPHDLCKLKVEFW